VKGSGLWIWLAISIIVPVLFVGVTFAMCGVGHGDCRLLIVFPVLFPYATLLSVMFPYNVGLLLILALVQFPMYVLACGQSRGTPRHGLVRTLILISHGFAVVLAFMLWP
jgi:hypothetical protein